MNNSTHPLIANQRFLITGMMLTSVFFMLDIYRLLLHRYSFDYLPTDLHQTTPLVFGTYAISILASNLFLFFIGMSFKVEFWTFNRKKLFTIAFVFADLLYNCTILNTIDDINSWQFTIYLNAAIALWIIPYIVKLSERTLWILLFTYIAFHNLLDTVHFFGYSEWVQLMWAMIHSTNVIELNKFYVQSSYPIVSILMLFVAGYLVASWYIKQKETSLRIQQVLNYALILFILFIILRAIQFVLNQYSYVFYPDLDDTNFIWFMKDIAVQFMEHGGDKMVWEIQDNWFYSIMSFFNLTPFPPSQFYFVLSASVFFLFVYLYEKRFHTMTFDINVQSVFIFFPATILFIRLCTWILMWTQKYTFQELFRVPLYKISFVVNWSMIYVILIGFIFSILYYLTDALFFTKSK